MSGLEFFHLLNADDEFCAQLGRTILAAGRLETALKRYLLAAVPAIDVERATMGLLVSHLKTHGLATKLLPHLRLLTNQRNYLTHNIHSLLSDLIPETILERTDLLESDTITYQERAKQLAGNLEDLALFFEKAASTRPKSAKSAPRRSRA